MSVDRANATNAPQSIEEAAWPAFAYVRDLLAAVQETFAAVRRETVEADILGAVANEAAVVNARRAYAIIRSRRETLSVLFDAINAEAENACDECMGWIEDVPPLYLETGGLKWPVKEAIAWVEAILRASQIYGERLPEWLPTAIANAGFIEDLKSNIERFAGSPIISESLLAESCMVDEGDPDAHCPPTATTQAVTIPANHDTSGQIEQESPNDCPARSSGERKHATRRSQKQRGRKPEISDETFERWLKVRRDYDSASSTSGFDREEFCEARDLAPDDLRRILNNTTPSKLKRREEQRNKSAE